jgi:Tol biopolymer transport system component
LEQPGRIVEKNELMNRLWPDSFVEEANLTFNIQQVRKALGDNARHPVFIETVARRGYRFVADVEEVLTDSEQLQSQMRFDRKLAGTSSPTSDAWPAREPPSNAAEVPQLEPSPGNPTPTILHASVSGSSNRRRSFSIAAAAGGLMLLASIWVVWRFGYVPERNQNGDKHAGVMPSASLPSVKLERLTASGTSRYAVISPDGKYVAYTSETKRQLSIWLMQLATNTTVEIVPSNGEGIYGLAFAHGGEHLYFVRGGGGAPLALYRVSSIGGLPAKLVTNLQGSFSLSPDDSKVAFIRYSDDDKECALVIANADGSQERELVVHAQPDRFNTPAWSPDGRSIAVAVGPSDSGAQQVRLVVFNAADGANRELSSEKWFHIRRLAWLPDKTGLFIVGARRGEDTHQIWKISYPAGSLSRITDSLASYLDLSLTVDAGKAVATQMTLNSNIWIGSSREPQSLRLITQAVGSFCWTPHGKIVYSSHTGPGRNLWIMQADGTEQRQLTDTRYNAAPAISTDGRYVVFISNRTGSFQLWRMNFDGSNQVQLTNGRGLQEPTISPDARWVVYHSVDDWQLWKISIDGGEPVRLTERRAKNPSVSPDGKWIACFGRDARQNPQIMIVPFEGGRAAKEFDISPLRPAAVRLQWTPDGKALIYAASHGGSASLYKQSLYGGEPHKLVNLYENDIFDFGLSPDGRYLAAIRGNWHHDVVLISG